jgi:PAS domain S-box-containing protein
MSRLLQPDGCKVLISAPLGRDADYLKIMLAESEIDSSIIGSLPELAASIDNQAAAVIVTSEAIATQDLSPLIEALRAQPAWSDLPFIYLAPPRQSSPGNRQITVINLLSEKISNVMVLERPLSKESLISAVKWAISARNRQFTIRDQLEELREYASQVRASNEMVELALNSGAVLGTWVWQVQEDIVTGDERFANTFGLDYQLVKTGISLQTYIDVVHPQDVSYLQGKIEEVLHRGGSYRAEYRVKDVKGVWRWIEANGNCELDENGVPVRFPGLLIDIGERKKIEESLLRSESELRLVTDSLPVLIAFVDTQHRIQFVNKAAENWFFEDSAKVVGMLLDTLINEHLGNTAIPYIDRALQGESIQFQGPWPKIDHGRREAKIRFLPRYTPFNEVDGFHLFVIDITDSVLAEEVLQESQMILEQRVAERTAALEAAMNERRQVEDALRQSQKMEAVGQLTGGIAHDFNNLLQGITGSLQVIKTGLELGKQINTEKYIDNALKSAFRAAGLTHRLLAFSRRQPLDPKPVHINPLVLSMEDLLLRTLGENIELNLMLANDIWETLCDANQLENAILNLAINARDAMPNGGKLTIETSNVIDKKFGSNEQAEFIKISVSDTGVGMTPDVIERAFEPFYTTKPQGEGTGLGLSMIYGFTRQSEGYSKIDSAPNHGTTIHLYLPRNQTTHETTESTELVPTPDQVKAEGRVVLVVEDDEIVRGLVVEILQEYGFNTIQANDGPSGLEILRGKERIDLLVTDIGLPGLNGRQIADAALVERSNLKVLFMTGYAENAASSSGFLRKNMAMITKPFEMKSLINRINELI